MSLSKLVFLYPGKTPLRSLDIFLYFILELFTFLYNKNYILIYSISTVKTVSIV